MAQSSDSYPCYSARTDMLLVDLELVSDFTTFLTEVRGLKSINHHRLVADCFLNYLRINDCPLVEAQAKQIQAFITEQGLHYKRKTLAAITCFLRSFLRYLAFSRHLPKDISRFVQGPYLFQGEREPRYLQDWQARKILTSAGQSSIKEKRDYAILFLLIVYGLRAGEVISLVLDDLLWRSQKIVFRDRKGGDTMELPMTPEVACALVAYLRVRPQSNHRNVFLSAIKPIVPLGRCALYHIANKVIESSGFVVAHPGAHTFRYSHAQELFAQGCSVPDIASALGHRNHTTTLGYLSFTVHPLREVALNAGEELA